MPIYKYTLVKYMKSVSTWVIAGISILLVIVLGGYLPFHYFSPEKNNAIINYGVISIALVAGITSFLSIFTSVFAGFKSATMYKDEVEDGTFLVMLSKPITRSKIIFFKWLALQTAIVIYTFIVALSFAIAIVSFDNGYKVSNLGSWGIHTLRSQAFIISVSLWGILFVVSLIFSSIALLLSTRLSVGTTIGISIALGVIIPITSLVGTFTAKQKYYTVSSNNPISLSSGLSAINGMKTNGNNLVDPVNTLYGLGVETKENDAFKFAQVFDLNYQIQTLSEFASEHAIPDSMKGAIASSGNRQTKVTNTQVSSANTIPISADHQSQIAAFNALVINSWKTTEIYRLGFINELGEILKQHLTGEITFSFDKEKTTIDSSNKDAIFGGTATGFDASWKNALIPYQAWEAKYNAAADADAKSLVAREYYLANAYVYKVAEAIYKNVNLISTASDKEKSIAKLIGSELVVLEEPINFWISEENFAKLRNDNYKNEETNIKPYTTTLGVLSGTVEGIDNKIMGEVVSAINNDFHIVKVNTVDYVNKYTILWIYLSLALGLVPVSYFVVRKQDFR